MDKTEIVIRAHNTIIKTYQKKAVLNDYCDSKKEGILDDDNHTNKNIDLKENGNGFTSYENQNLHNSENSNGDENGKVNDHEGNEYRILQPDYNNNSNKTTVIYHLCRLYRCH